MSEKAENKLQSQIKNITSSDLFLAFIEPKKFATEQVLNFIKNNLSDENLKKLVKKSMSELCDVLPTEKIIEIEIHMLEEGEEKHVQNLREQCYKTLEEYKQKRIKPISHRFAILTILNNQIYDFIKGDYINLNDYYINYIMPFKDVFLDLDWALAYNNKPILILEEHTKYLIEEFINNNQNKIDEKAYQKIFKP